MIDLIELLDGTRKFKIVFDENLTKDCSHVYIYENIHNTYPIYDRTSNYNHMCRLTDDPIKIKQLEYYYKNCINSFGDLLYTSKTMLKLIDL